MKRVLIIIASLFLLTGCAPSESAIQTAIAETFTAYPTSTTTATNTETPLPTSTTTATITNTATITRTKAPTKTATITFTPEDTKLPWQKTKEIQDKTATYIGSFDTVSWRDFITYPDQYQGKKITISCRVFNVVSTKEIQCYVSGTYEAFYVTMKDSFTGIYEDTTLKIYGTGNGQKCFENSYGAQICQPLISKAFFVK
jgi:hypothetical protein